ncbi:MAG: hypothetical protein QG646_520 [Euryarchaeota archaeon]|nr:hypothetical protein [Euryarchaeota archaeon]
MKKFSFLTLILLSTVFLCVGVGTALGASSNGNINSASLQVSLTNQNPDAARPGEPVELTLSVQNVGNKDLQDITVTVTPEYPLSSVSGEALKKSISYLNARQDDDNAGVLKFKLLVDSNALEGTYDVDITTTAKESGTSNIVTTTKTIQVEVRGKEYAQIVTINKASIDVGKEEPLEFMITNTGNSPLKNMVISWKDPKGVILPVYSDNTKYIKYLAANQSATVAYSVMADVSATPGLYTLDVNLNFEDYDSKNETIQTTAGLFVGGPTDFDVSFSESSQGEVSLSVANVGNNIAYAVKVSVPKQDGYKTSGSSSTIVGNLEKGDYTIASFSVASTQAQGGNAGAQPGASTNSAKASGMGGNATSAAMNENPLKVQIEYTDAKGDRLTVDKEVKLELTSGNMTAQGGSGRQRSSGFSSYLLYLVVIVLAGGVYVYRNKIQEKIQARKGKKSGKIKPESKMDQ